MKYISTRGQTAPMNFSDVLLMGLAPGRWFDVA